MKSITMVKAAVGQICSTSSMSHNLSICKYLAGKAVEDGAKVLFLPEASDYIANNPTESLALARPMDSSPFVLGIRKVAKELFLAVNVGIHVPAPDNKVFNRSCWINAEGEIESYYDKLHLFDYGELKESSTVQAGKEIVKPVESVIGRLRFPEISLALKRQNAQVIAYPSAFTVKTGIAHWSLLLRARAIETQAYVIAAAQIGPHNLKRTSYGHSLVVDPWGKILLEMSGEGSEPEYGIVDIDLEYQEKIKTEMPLSRRT
ncbi:hypothetical protein HYALB_00000998 [Hymenoscyphus albidus]|uniref:CN hydrolase domain-containing protein n=1 Tax=Hymenoscyphus albidus TaxID=595503 RepID=A0A9N9M280_9HELO|nr:hypothetical protein HYALB_00000998 [Hymenoscyphus albidus]